MRLGRTLRHVLISSFAFASVVVPSMGLSIRASLFSTVTGVFVNGGADTVDGAGATCILLADPVQPSCPQGIIAIPNQNSKLIAAALAARAGGNPVWAYYEDSAPLQTCPGIAYTPCSLITLGVK